MEEAKDWVEIPGHEHFESDDYYLGAIETTMHLLSVADDMMLS
jgi:hypothetical protein